MLWLRHIFVRVDLIQYRQLHSATEKWYHDKTMTLHMWFHNIAACLVAFPALHDSCLYGRP